MLNCIRPSFLRHVLPIASMFKIRPFHPSDLPALYRICLLTGDNGGDASTLYADPDLLAHFYAGPYAVLAPDLCFVLTKAGVPVGYVLGVADSAEFAQACEAHWFPPLRGRYPMPPKADRSADANLIRLLHRGHVEDVRRADYPAHLHIDILPAGQGHGFGRKLLETLFQALRAKKVPGVYLGVSRANANAVGFYRKIGFSALESYPSAIVFGMRL